MWTRASVAALVLAAFFGRAGDCVECASKIGTSLLAFERNFQTLGRHERLNAVDRVILSLMLSGPVPHKAKTGQAAPQAARPVQFTAD